MKRHEVWKKSATLVLPIGAVVALDPTLGQGGVGAGQPVLRPGRPRARPHLRVKNPVAVAAWSWSRLPIEYRAMTIWRLP